VADTGNHAIRRIGTDGQVTTLAGGEQGHADGPAAQARFDAPMGIAVDAQGQVYVADTFNDRIRVIGTDGNVRTLAGGDRPGLADGVGAAARFDTPVALAFDAQGALLVADLFNNAVRRVGADGTVSTVVAAGGVINGPLSLATTHDGVLYVGDLDGRIVQVTPQGHQIALVGNGRLPRLARPSGLAMDADGSVLVADAASYRLHRLRPLPVGDLPAPALVGPAADAALPKTGGRWPLAPQDGWHEVVGTLGEVRGNFTGESRHHLHGGFDVRGDVGQTVLAIAEGKISSPVAAWNLGEQAEAWRWIASSTSTCGSAAPRATNPTMRAGRRCMTSRASWSGCACAAACASTSVTAWAASTTRRTCTWRWVPAASRPTRWRWASRATPTTSRRASPMWPCWTTTTSRWPQAAMAW
jgi:hypothetical protein